MHIIEEIITVYYFIMLICILFVDYLYFLIFISLVDNVLFKFTYFPFSGSISDEINYFLVILRRQLLDIFIEYFLNERLLSFLITTLSLGSVRYIRSLEK